MYYNIIYNNIVYPSSPFTPIRNAYRAQPGACCAHAHDYNAACMRST